MLINEQWNALYFIIIGNNRKTSAKAGVCITKLRDGLWRFAFLSDKDPNADFHTDQIAHMLRCRFEHGCRLRAKLQYLS